MLSVMAVDIDGPWQIADGFGQLRRALGRHTVVAVGQMDIPQSMPGRRL
jgi:hypothetical protein